MKKASIVVGLGFGDECKGSTVDFLASRNTTKAVVRFNGGSQAAHNVHVGDKHHTFSQFGSASLIPGVKTFLSPYMYVNPMALLNEGFHLQELGQYDIFTRMSIHKDCVVITPYHRAMNRILEINRGTDKHGSCGVGFGVAVDNNLNGLSVNIGDFKSGLAADKLKEIKKAHLNFLNNTKLSREAFYESLIYDDDNLIEQFIWDSKIAVDICNVVDMDYFADLMGDGSVIFEGAQGALLDENFGFKPYNTWSTTSNLNALRMLKDIYYDGEVETIGVMRAVGTRHGAGPFPTEDVGLNNILNDEHNKSSQWQDNFRFGYLDLPLMKYAIDTINNNSHLSSKINCKVSSLSISCLDQFHQLPVKKVCVDHTGYKNLPPYKAIGGSSVNYINDVIPVFEEMNTDVVPFIESRLGVDVGVISRGKDRSNRIMLDKRG